MPGVSTNSISSEYFSISLDIVVRAAPILNLLASPSLIPSNALNKELFPELTTPVFVTVTLLLSKVDILFCNFAVSSLEIYLSITLVV